MHMFYAVTYADCVHQSLQSTYQSKQQYIDVSYVVIDNSNECKH